MLGKVECATGMGQRRNDAAVKGVQTKSSEEDRVEGTELIAHKMKLLHLGQNTGIIRLQPSLFPISVPLDLQSMDRKEVLFLKR